MAMTILALRRNWLSTMTAALRHWVHAIPPLSSCPRGTRMFFKGIVCCALVCLVSCRSLDVVSSSEVQEVQEVQKFWRVDTIVQRDTLYRHDSVIYRERTVHDTVYITKEVFRDALNSKFLIQNSAKTDTVVVTEYRDRVVAQPPERYVPKFYKWCTIALWAIIALIIGRILLKRYWL